jgi:disulfide bond formation protein DsbB
VGEALGTVGQEAVSGEGTGRPSRLASPATGTALGALVLAATVASVPLQDLAHQLSVSSFVGQGIAVLIYTVVGVVVRRQPRNAMGWILLFAIFLFSFSADLGTYAVLHYNLAHHGLPLAALAVALYPMWVPGVALFPLIVVLFPDGKLPSPRWRWVLRSYFVLCACVVTAVFTQAITAVLDHDIHLDSEGDVKRESVIPVASRPSCSSAW